jgi:hypothetical protein
LVVSSMLVEKCLTDLGRSVALVFNTSSELINFICFNENHTVSVTSTLTANITTEFREETNDFISVSFYLNVEFH